MEKGQVFQVEIDGVVKEAELMDVVDFNEERYAVYSVEAENETNEIYVSKVVTDSEGYDELVDEASDEVKEYVINLIQEAIKS